MNIAICLIGQLRSFSNEYQSLIQNLILPLQKSCVIGKVDIFINGFSYNINDYYATFDKLKYSLKLEVDTPGADDIINNSPYIKKSNIVTFSDNTIDMLFSKFNDKNLSNFSEMLKNKSIFYHKTDRFYNLFYLGLSQHYNNMIGINQVGDEYDIIVRTRCDMKYLNSNVANNIIIFAQGGFKQTHNKRKKRKKKISGSGKTSNLCILKKGELWDQIFFGTSSVMKSIYKNFDERIVYFYKEFMNGRKRRAENMLQNFVKNTPKKNIKLISLEYDKDFTRIYSSQIIFTGRKGFDSERSLNSNRNTNNINYWNKVKNLKKNQPITFIHTPKCAGKFVAQILKRLKIKNKKHVSANKDTDGITFTVIRHPVERFESFMNFSLAQSKLGYRYDWPKSLHHVWNDTSINLNEIVEKMSDKELSNFHPYKSLSYWSQNVDICITIDKLEEFLSFFGFKINLKEFEKVNVSNKIRGKFNEVTINRISNIYSEDMDLFKRLILD